MPKYSVVTPVHLWNQDRVDKFLVCADSLRNQTFKDFEWVVVNDGSVEEFLWATIMDVCDTVKIIHQPHLERVNAYNKAFEQVEGNWVTLLDSDDEYKPSFFTQLNKMIKKYPKEKMFNFGAAYQHQDGSFTFRDPFMPKRKYVGHEMFGPGNIVNGTFIFAKEILDQMGGFPPMFVEEIDCSEINYGEGPRTLAMSSPWDFSAAAQMIFPEIRQYFFIDRDHDPNKAIRELGNPWGQDFFLFYKYTRMFHSRAVKDYLYIVHSR